MTRHSHPTRIAGFVLLLTVPCIALAAPASCQVPPAPPIQLLEKPLVVGVFNALDGSPVANASVALVGHNLFAVTDGTGHASFAQVPSVRVLRLWTYPAGFTPGAQEVRLGTSPVEWASVFVMPQDMYSTGLISHVSGGTFTFNGTTEGALGATPFWFQITVPPNALGQDFSLGISPRPTFAEATNGLTGWTLTLGQWHVNLRNAAGEIISQTLNVPAQFRFKPWTLPGIGLEDPASYPPGMFEYRLYRYDYGINQFVELANVVSPNASDGTVSVPIQSFSFFTAKKRGYGLWAAGGPPPPPPPEPEVDETYQCDTLCSGAIACGSYDQNCSYTQAAGTSATITAGFKAALESQYGSSAGVALAKVSTKVGMKFEVSVTGEYSSTTTETVSGSIQQGAGGSGVCFSGPFKFKKVSKVYTISILGVTVGTVTKTTGTEVAKQLSFDSSCGPQCEHATTPQPAVTSCPF